MRKAGATRSSLPPSFLLLAVPRFRRVFFFWHHISTLTETRGGKKKISLNQLYYMEELLQQQLDNPGHVALVQATVKYYIEKRTKTNVMVPSLDIFIGALECFEEALDGREEVNTLLGICAYVLWARISGIACNTDECTYWATLGAERRVFFLNLVKSIIFQFEDSFTAHRFGPVAMIRGGFIFGSEPSGDLKRHLIRDVPSTVLMGAFGLRFSLHVERAERRGPGLCFFIILNAAGDIHSWPIIMGPGDRRQKNFVVVGCNPSVEAETLPQLLEEFAHLHADKAKYFITPRLIADGPLPLEVNKFLFRCTEEFLGATSVETSQSHSSPSV